MRKFILISSLTILTFLTACAEIEPKPFVPSSGHINAETQPAEEIPELVTTAPALPVPAPAVQLEKYTVVVNEVPVKELLFALARDAQVNVDIDPTIEGVVTINAIDQTLYQILDRIARQVDLRYESNGDNLFIQPDVPYLRTYTIDYVNMSRDTSSTNTVATQISSTSGGGDPAAASGGGGNNSTTDVTSISNHHFWETLVLNISAILGDEVSAGGGGAGQLPITNTVIPNPEAGVIVVRATAMQHQQIQGFIDQTQERVQRQVLIRVTIAEVRLSEEYQAGIDWSFLQKAAGFSIISATILGAPVVGALGALKPFIFEYQDPNPDNDRLQASVKLLDEFGNVRIMSSPQIMVLNNQTATLKVVENIVYFEIDVEPGLAVGLVVTDPAIETTAVTLPVGIVMAVTPQISSSGVISLNVRPTISRVTEFVLDPNPEIAKAGQVNPVPQVEIREMESMLRLIDGQIGVLGGLMLDISSDGVDGLPGVSNVPGIGAAFKTTTKEYEKTELVIFIQPTIIQNPSLDGDLSRYRQYLNPSRASLLPPEGTLPLEGHRKEIRLKLGQMFLSCL